MKLAKFCISSTRRISTKLLAISESSTKINIRLHLTLTVILFTSAVICKQRLLLENETVPYLENCKCYDVNQGQFRKLVQSPTNVITYDYHKTIRTFFTGRSIFNFF